MGLWLGLGLGYGWGMVGVCVGMGGLGCGPFFLSSHLGPPGSVGPGCALQLDIEWEVLQLRSSYPSAQPLSFSDHCMITFPHSPCPTLLEQAPSALLTFAFHMANVASRPHLRVRRLRNSEGICSTVHCM